MLTWWTEFHDLVESSDSEFRRSQLYPIVALRCFHVLLTWLIRWEKTGREVVGMISYSQVLWSRTSCKIQPGILRVSWNTVFVLENFEAYWNYDVYN